MCVCVCVCLSVPMLRAQIFTLQSAEPLKINLSLSDKDRDQAGERANTDRRAGGKYLKTKGRQPTSIPTEEPPRSTQTAGRPF